MVEGTVKYKSLLGVELYQISEKFIYKLRKDRKDVTNIFSYLPIYTTNTNKEANNEPIIAEYFHQFIGFIENEDNNYLYFNLKTIDNSLQEEIDNAGIDNMFENFDFEKILSVFTPEPEENLQKFMFANTNYLIVEITYLTSYDNYNGGYECETSYNIIGYLDKELVPKYFEK